MKKLSIVVAIIAVAVAAYMWWPNVRPADGPVIEQPARIMAIEDYMRQNISDLSPIKEQVGGTFFVTDIQAANGKGVVSYEDGHNAYTADFTYTTDIDRGHTISSFVIR